VTVRWLSRLVRLPQFTFPPLLRVSPCTGILMNALPKLINLRNVHISASTEGIMPVLRMLQTCSPRLRGLSVEYVCVYCHPLVPSNEPSGLRMPRLTSVFLSLNISLIFHTQPQGAPTTKYKTSLPRIGTSYGLYTLTTSLGHSPQTVSQYETLRTFTS
jgi:hypothetical protein